MTDKRNVVRFKSMLPKGCEAWCPSLINGIWYDCFMHHKGGKLIPWYVPRDCNADGG